MSYAVWYSVFQPSTHNQFILPYTAQSPITRNVKSFNTVNDIWDEIEIVANSERNKRSLGQELWYLIPLFANPIYVLSNHYINLINEYYYVTEYHIPLAKNLDDADAVKLESFTIIRNELTQAKNEKQKKENGTRRKN